MRLPSWIAEGVWIDIRRERDIVVLSVAMFTFSLAFQATSRYLSVLGAGAVVIGLFGSLSSLLAALYPYPGGVIADRVGSRRALTGYSVAVREAAGFLEAAEEFEARRAEAERYAQIVNEVRQHFGQEPMSFDRLGELNKVAPVELTDAPMNESNTTGFRAALEWSQRTLVAAVDDDPYDPTQEVGGEAGASDLEKAVELHSTRDEKAQEMDESIQARDQVTDFETWAEAPNMKDFIGVDDLNSVLDSSEYRT